MANSALFIAIAQPGGAVGRALKAGIAGTLAITFPEKASGKIEMKKITRRGNGDAQQHVAGKVPGIEAREGRRNIF